MLRKQVEFHFLYEEGRRRVRNIPSEPMRMRGCSLGRPAGVARNRLFTAAKGCLVRGKGLFDGLTDDLVALKQAEKARGAARDIVEAMVDEITKSKPSRKQ